MFEEEAVKFSREPSGGGRSEAWRSALLLRMLSPDAIRPLLSGARSSRADARRALCRDARSHRARRVAGLRRGVVGGDPLRRRLLPAVEPADGGPGDRRAHAK